MVATVPNSLLIIGFVIQTACRDAVKKWCDANTGDYKVLNQWISFWIAMPSQHIDDDAAFDYLSELWKKQDSKQYYAKRWMVYPHSYIEGDMFSVVQ